MINPASGPGDSQSSTYVSRVSDAHAAGALVIAYVTSDYTNVGLTTVEDEIDKYYLWYDVDGIFIDEATTSCTDEDNYYHPLYNYIKGKSSSAIVITNQGTGTPSCFLASADIIVTLENYYTAYVNSFSSTNREWETPANANRIWHIVHDAFGESQMQNALDLSRDRNAGYIFVGESSYSSLPAYWQAEADDVTAFNEGLPGGSSGLTWLRASNNATTNTYRFEFPADTYSFLRVYIDTDENTATGFANCSIGADYLIENSHLYDYTGDGSSWSWADLGTVTNTLGSTSAIWTIARSAVGESASPNAANACFVTKTAAGVKTTSAPYHHAYSDESGPVHAYFAENDSTTIRYQADFDTSYAQKHVFIDTDSSSGTGYSVGGIGADYMVENGSVYDYTGTGGSNWAWTSLGSSSMTPSTIGATGTTTWTIARSTIGETGASESSRLVFHGRVSGGASEYTAPIYIHAFSN